MTLRRGFKAHAEREAARLRAELGLAKNDRLDPRKLAAYKEIAVIDAADLVGRERLEELERIQSYAFSAATFKVEEQTVIVVSPLRDEGRQNSDIAHELSHILLGHKLSELRQLNGIAFRTCTPEQEEEATSFGGTLLLPRPLLLSAAQRQAGIDDIAAQYRVTRDMARFRYNTTGVGKQAARSGR